MGQRRQLAVDGRLLRALPDPLAGVVLHAEVGELIDPLLAEVWDKVGVQVPALVRQVGKSLVPGAQRCRHLLKIILGGFGKQAMNLAALGQFQPPFPRSEEHTSELQSLMRISYAVFCLKKKTQ